MLNHAGLAVLRSCQSREEKKNCPTVSQKIWTMLTIWAVNTLHLNQFAPGRRHSHKHIRRLRNGGRSRSGGSGSGAPLSRHRLDRADSQVRCICPSPFPRCRPAGSQPCMPPTHAAGWCMRPCSCVQTSQNHVWKGSIASPGRPSQLSGPCTSLRTDCASASLICA